MNLRRWSIMKAPLTILLTALTPIIWGSSYLVTTEWLPPGQPFKAAMIRTLPVGMVLLLRYRFRLPRDQWGRLILLSVLNIFVLQATLFMAAYRLPGGFAAVVGAAQPLVVLLLAWLMDRERPAKVALLGGVIAVGAMVVLFASPGQSLDPWGLAAAGVGTISMATGTFLSRRWQQELPVLAFTGWQLLIGGLLLAPLALLLDPPIEHLSGTHVAGFIYLSIIGSLLAYPLWFRGIARLSPVAVSALTLLSPLTALILGWVVLGQSLSWTQLAAMSVVLSAVMVLQWRRAPVSKSESSFSAPPQTFSRL